MVELSSLFSLVTLKCLDAEKKTMEGKGERHGFSTASEYAKYLQEKPKPMTPEEQRALVKYLKEKG